MTNTKAIYLSSIPYKDNSYVLKLYTESHGLMSFLSNHSKRKKIKHLLYPLTQLDLSFRYKNDKGIQSVKTIERTEQGNLLEFDPVKNGIKVFVAEVILNSITEEEQNLAKFEFFIAFLEALNEASTPESQPLPIMFLVKYLHFLGISPGFEGSNKQPQLFSSESWQNLCEIEKGDNSMLKHPPVRKKLIDELIQYYMYYLEHFRYPKSIDVLRELVKA